jgi:hypothetical protein
MCAWKYPGILSQQCDTYIRVTITSAPGGTRFITVASSFTFLIVAFQCALLLFAGSLIDPSLDHTEPIDIAVEIFTSLTGNPTAARLLEFVKALIPLVNKGSGPVDAPAPVVDMALFDDLLNFDFNSLGGDYSLNWLVDIQ